MREWNRNGCAAGRVARAFALIALLGVAACASKKQTWQDWVEAADPEDPPPAVERVALTPTITTPVVYAKPYKAGDAAKAGEGFDLEMRNPDFPNTHIEAIYIDLTGPKRPVTLVWTGSLAPQGPVGPWRSCPGRGRPGTNCNDVKTSNTNDTWCTPKGVFPAAGFSDRLYLTPYCHYATWVVHKPRYIAIHSSPDIPDVPASAGCIRVPYDVAKLIHNNTIAGKTLIRIDGEWTPPPRVPEH